MSYFRKYIRRLYLALMALSMGMLVCAFIPAYGGSSNFYYFIARFDLSPIWSAGRIITNDKRDTVYKPEALGFIGDHYQRFYIHFVNIFKSPDESYRYYVYGKTMRDGHVRDFQGTLYVKEARLYNESLNDKYKEGYVSGDYEFSEDPKSKQAGVLSGHFTSKFAMDNGYEVAYDALALGTDDYSNDQFEGTWRSYKDGTTKKCNWGDFRIPGSDSLDIGRQEFIVAQPYIAHGWESYVRSKGGDTYSPEAVKKAKALENRHWWE